MVAAGWGLPYLRTNVIGLTRRTRNTVYWRGQPIVKLEHCSDGVLHMHLNSLTRGHKKYAVNTLLSHCIP